VDPEIVFRGKATLTCTSTSSESLEVALQFVCKQFGETDRLSLLHVTLAVTETW